MSLDITKIKDGIEAVINLTVGFFGLCCGHVTLQQCSSLLGFFANFGGAALVVIQVIRTLKKKDTP